MFLGSVSVRRSSGSAFGGLQGKCFGTGDAGVAAAVRQSFSAAQRYVVVRLFTKCRISLGDSVLWDRSSNDSSACEVSGTNVDE